MKKIEDCSKLLLEVVPRTMRLIRAEMRSFAAGDFTIPQFRVLGRLARQPSSNNDLAEWMGVRAPTMTKMIDKLVTRGFVQRKVVGTDRRQVLLSCTKKGLSRTRAIRNSVQSKLAVNIRSLTEKERAELTAGLLVLEELFSHSNTTTTANARGDN